MSVKIVTSILTLIAGVGVFLIACSMMSSNLEAVGSKKLKSLFTKASKSKLVGVGVGTVTTAVIQSSSATSVMVIGFVNAGIMSLAQAATVIFGANIGTTVTGQLVALGMFNKGSVPTSVIFATLAGVGAFILAFAKKDKTQKIGGIMAGFGMLFVGLTLMGDSMSFFSELEGVKLFLAKFENPLVLVLIGTIITGIIQSSSVMTSMAITMVVTGLINLNQGIYITMGANIGTCVTALIAGMTSTRNAKRTALIHLIFNVSGVIIFMIAGLIIGVRGVNYGVLFNKTFPNAPQLQMSVFHTIFNVTTVIIVLPMTNLLVKLVTKLIPEKAGDLSDEPCFKYLEEHMLATPPIAAQQVKNEVLRMAEIANENFNISCDLCCTLNYEKADIFRKNEKTLDFLNRELTRFVSELLKADLSEKDRNYLSTVYRSAADLERVGDYAENLTEYSDKLKEANGKFSPEAVAEIRLAQKTVNDLFGSVVKTYDDGAQENYLAAMSTEDKVDNLTNEMADNHIDRLERGECTPEVGAQYLSLAANIERIADHYVNVARAAKNFQQ